MGLAANGEKEGITVSPKALASFVGAMAVAFGGGYASSRTEAHAGGQPSDVAVAVLTRRFDDYERTNEKRLERMEANLALLVARGSCEVKK